MSSAILSINNNVPHVQADVTAQPAWLRLAKEAREEVRFVSVEKLKLHPATNILVFHDRSYEVVRESVQLNGVLYPLAIAADGRVLDGRYRLEAAKELGIESLPVLTVTLPDEPKAAEHWVFEMKDSREHLDEGERAFLAFEYKNLLKAANIKGRTAKMNKARVEKTTAKALPAPKKGPKEAKKDSRQMACEKYKVSPRKVNDVGRLANQRPDLYDKVKAGKMKLQDALKKKGRNNDAARAELAMAAVVRPEDVADGEIENRIHCGDAAEMLKRVPDGVASLILTSPPYYGVYNDEYDPPLPPVTYPEYLAGIGTVISESYRVSRPGGRLALVIDDVQNPDAGSDCDETVPVVADVIKLAQACGWRYWLPIPWLKREVTGSKKTVFGSLGLCSAPSLGRAYESILVFFKEQKGLEGDPTLCDLDRKEHINWWPTPWTIPAETRRDILAIHPAAYSEELPTRLIKLLTFRRDLVIDPYNGSGTTTCVASRLGRRFTGIDRSQKYCGFARARLAPLAESL